MQNDIKVPTAPKKIASSETSNISAKKRKENRDIIEKVKHA